MLPTAAIPAPLCRPPLQPPAALSPPPPAAQVVQPSACLLPFIGRRASIPRALRCTLLRPVTSVGHRSGLRSGLPLPFLLRLPLPRQSSLPRALSPSLTVVPASRTPSASRCYSLYPPLAAAPVCAPALRRPFPSASSYLSAPAFRRSFLLAATPASHAPSAAHRCGLSPPPPAAAASRTLLGQLPAGCQTSTLAAVRRSASI